MWHLGKISDKNEILHIMSDSGCLVVPSLCYENSPGVIYEAYSVGLPVLAAKIGGIPELINEFGGYLFETNSHADLTSKMSLITASKKDLIKIGNESLSKIGRLSTQNYINNIEQLF